MKQLIISFFIGLLVTAKLSAQTPIAPSVGDGTAAHPFEIATWQNLYWLTRNNNYWASGYYFIQTADIDLTTATPDITTWNDNSSDYGWPMIGSNRNDIYFEGNYDGQNHYVKGVYIKGYLGFDGLFGITRNATIKNLGVIDANITISAGGAEQWFVGALVGYAINSTIENCYSTGNVTSAYIGVGGLIGRLQSGTTVKRCYSSCNVTINGYLALGAGGLIGYNYGSSVADCYATGNVTGATNTEHIGGLVGLNSNTISTINCYSTGHVSCASHTPGGLMGYHSGGSVSNCF